MKRAFLATLILATGITLFLMLYNATLAAQREYIWQKSAAQTQTQQIAQLRLEKQQWDEHWRIAQELLNHQSLASSLTRLEEKILSGASLENLSAAESEQLLAELGFSWNTTGDFLIISKKSLAAIDFSGLKGTKLTGAARAILAITPEEQSAIEAATQQIGDARTAWAKEHVQRTEPSGDMLAQYTLPADPEFAANQMTTFTNAIVGALGSQRAQWLQDHSSQWMQDSGLSEGVDFSKIPEAYLSMAAAIPEHQNQPTSLTLNRRQAGNDWYINVTLKQAGNNMSYDVLPQQPFPAAFSPLFPGGWQELAQREGFELPKEFKQL
ncbi:MAG TPA: hypothetical protein VGO57_11280 [Verrucomicrobiae bacterium]|jgi:hypothetical protein